MLGVGVLGGCVWLARRVRRSGVGTGLLGPVDEIYQPSAWRLRQEIQVYEERTVPDPSPDDFHRDARPSPSDEQILGR